MRLFTVRVFALWSRRTRVNMASRFNQGIPVLEVDNSGFPVDKNTGLVGHDVVRKAVS